MRKLIAALTVAASVMVATPAQADQPKPRTVCQKAAPLRAKVIHKFGVRAPGRDICKYGLNKPGHPFPNYTQRDSYRDRLKALLTPPRQYLVRTAVTPRNAPAGTLSAGVAASSVLQRIAQCESGGNPRAVDPSGSYFGKYQFSPSTWASVGGTGNPAAASEAEQDKRAAVLYARTGPSSWPICGYR